MKHLLLILLLGGACQLGFAQTAPQKTTADSAAKAGVTASAKSASAPAPVVVTKSIWRTPAMDEAMAYY